jgi:hypothetical protein
LSDTGLALPEDWLSSAEAVVADGESHARREEPCNAPAPAPAPSGPAGATFAPRLDQSTGPGLEDMGATAAMSRRQKGLKPISGKRARHWPKAWLSRLEKRSSMWVETRCGVAGRWMPKGPFVGMGFLLEGPG